MEYIDVKHLIIKNMEKQGYNILSENIEYHIENGTLFFRLINIVTKISSYVLWVKVPLVNACGGFDCTSNYSVNLNKIHITEEDFWKLRNTFDSAISTALRN